MKDVHKQLSDSVSSTSRGRADTESNPFPSAHSGYGRVTNRAFVSSYPQGSEMRKFHDNAQRFFRDFVGAENFPCVAGRTVARTDEYAFCAYPNMTDPKVAEGIMHDMIRFQTEFGIADGSERKGRLFRSFIVAFAEPKITDSLHGAETLYTLLSNMHTVNSKHFPWKEGFSSDMDSPNFGYSSGDSAFFIAYFHPKAYAQARVSPLTFVVFNSHKMLEVLKDKGKFAQLRDLIRSRQEEVHPYLGDHGETLEWRQYALLQPDAKTEQAEKALRRKVLGECPFKPT